MPVVSGPYRLQRSLKSSSQNRISTQGLGFRWEKEKEAAAAAAAVVCCFRSRFANEFSEGGGEEEWGVKEYPAHWPGHEAQH